MAHEDANSKLVEVVTVAYVDDKKAESVVPLAMFSTKNGHKKLQKI